MSLDPTSVRTEEDGDVVAQIIGAGPANIATVNADQELAVEDDDLEEALVSVGSDAFLIEQPSHDLLNVNATLQVGDVDVDSTNPVPVADVGTVGDNAADYQATAALAAQASETLSFAISNGTTGEIKRVFISSEAPFTGEIQTYDGTTASTVGYVNGEAGASQDFRPEADNASLFRQPNTGAGEEFRVIATNNNQSGVGDSAIIHVTFEFTEE